MKLLFKIMRANKKHLYNLDEEGIKLYKMRMMGKIIHSKLKIKVRTVDLMQIIRQFDEEDMNK